MTAVLTLDSQTLALPLTAEETLVTAVTAVHQTVTQPADWETLTGVTASRTGEGRVLTLGLEVAV